MAKSVRKTEDYTQLYVKVINETEDNAIHRVISYQKTCSATTYAMKDALYRPNSILSPNHRSNAELHAPVTPASQQKPRVFSMTNAAETTHTTVLSTIKHRADN